MKVSHAFLFLILTSCPIQPKAVQAPKGARTLNAAAEGSARRRVVAVADVIGMTQLADPLYFLGGSSEGRVAKFSPDGRRFTVLLKKGRLESKTNEYSILLFKTADVLQQPRPEVLLTMSSNSNRPAIKDLKWLNNETLSFLGENPNQLPQVYMLNCKTKELHKLADYPTEIISYDISQGGDKIVFIAEHAPKLPSKDESAGVIIKTQRISDILNGQYSEFGRTKYELFLKSETASPINVAIDDEVFTTYGEANIAFSPDARYAVIQVRVMNVPDKWKEYADPFIQLVINARYRPKGVAANVSRYMLIDTEKRSVVPLVDAPGRYLTMAFAWAPDSNSVFVSGTFLPLDVLDPAELKVRRERPQTVEITIPARTISKITDQELKLRSVDTSGNKLIFDANPLEGHASCAFERAGAGWKQAKATPSDLAAGSIQISLDEDLNTAPRIVAADPKTGNKALVLDLNPQFKDVAFGKVEEIEWRASDGHEVEGGVYLPPGYRSGKRYPLVIQTHGFTADRFWMDGPWATGFAAQPMAGKGIVVLQLGKPQNLEEEQKYVATPQEAPREMAEYEGAINHLDALGLIDRNRVGIIGFSRTCFHVKYSLTHSKYGFQAAAVADGTDAGYLQYLLSSTSSPQAASEFEAVNGGVPYGPGISAWIERSPGFSLHRVNTPLRIQAIGPGSVVFEWEWFAGLSILKKPVEMVLIPNGQHLLVKPQERLVSQEGNVDWFDFWLNGHEDPDPAKAEQYARWRELRKLQEENEKKGSGARSQKSESNTQ